MVGWMALAIDNLLIGVCNINCHLSNIDAFPSLEEEEDSPREPYPHIPRQNMPINPDDPYRLDQHIPYNPRELGGIPRYNILGGVYPVQVGVELEEEAENN